MNNIPLKIRKKIEQDPFYRTCALYGQHNHICDGRVTIEHTVVFAGKQLQELWALIGLCAHGHGVDEFQDDATTSKELREWVALSRATPSELAAISKAVSYAQRLSYLNGKYGLYKPIVPSPEAIAKAADVPKDPNSKRDWYLITPEDKVKIERLREFNKRELAAHFLPRQIIQMGLESLYLEVKNGLESTNSALYKELGFDK